MKLLYRFQQLRRRIVVISFLQSSYPPLSLLDIFLSAQKYSCSFGFHFSLNHSVMCPNHEYYLFMNTTPHIYAMIVAAGSGSRFGASTAKQYTLLQGQTLLQRSTARLASSCYIDKCLLVIAAEDRPGRNARF